MQRRCMVSLRSVYKPLSLTDVLCYSLNAVMRAEVYKGIMFDFYPGLSHADMNQHDSVNKICKQTKATGRGLKWFLPTNILMGNWVARFRYANSTTKVFIFIKGFHSIPDTHECCIFCEFSLKLCLNCKQWREGERGYYVTNHSLPGKAVMH